MLLFAWDGYEDTDTQRENRKTFIERLHLETQQRTLLYTHTETMEVVAATVNHECTLLGLTTITQYSELDFHFPRTVRLRPLHRHAIHALVRILPKMKTNEAPSCLCPASSWDRTLVCEV